MMKEVKFTDLIGKTITKITGGIGDSEMTFQVTSGETYKLYHYSDCCESVQVNDIAGDLQDLIGSPILLAEEATSGTNPPGVSMEYQDCYTWTFYKLATVKGYVTIRWYGNSNGYYSTSVDFDLVQP